MDDRRALTFRRCKRARLDGDVSFVVRGNEGRLATAYERHGSQAGVARQIAAFDIEIRIAERLTRMVSKRVSWCGLVENFVCFRGLFQNWRSS
jgi:hypothetical protein